jgi:hypothetical protein
MKRRSRNKSEPVDNRSAAASDYDGVLADMVDVLEAARRTSARAVNDVMTAAYWEIGRRIVEYEQGGAERAEYGSQLVRRLSDDLTQRFGRGFSTDNLELMRRFYHKYPREVISETPSRKLPGSQISEALSRKSGIDRHHAVVSEIPVGAANWQTPSAKSSLPLLARRFSLPWSHYVRLLKVEKPEARRFYETEALRGGWSVRQLDRQISTLFYERTLASRNKGAMLKKGAAPRAGELLTPEEEIKDPLVLEFLGLKHEYSETDLEEALIRQQVMTAIDDSPPSAHGQECPCYVVRAVACLI